MSESELTDPTPSEAALPAAELPAAELPAAEPSSNAFVEEPWRPRAAGPVPETLARLLRLPRPRTASCYALLDRRVEEGLLVEEFSFDSEPGEGVSGILVRPEDRLGPLPALLCLHDVNQGRKTVMGERYYTDSRVGWLRGWGREMARHGFVAAGITQRTFGKRPGELNEQAKIEQLHGRRLMGAFVWESLETLNEIAKRDDVDADRLGIVGYGLGGAVGFYTAVLDDRVKALVTLCGGIGSLDLFARWSDPNIHDLSYFIPDILEHFDHPDLVASLAPRAYLLMTRDADAGMPMDGVRRAEWEGGAAYRERAIEERFKVSVRAGSHDLTPDDVAEAVEWMSRWLSPEGARAFAESDPGAQED